MHPAHLLDDDDWAALEVWRRSRGGMGGAGHLPEAGGTLDQAAATMAAIDVMDGAYEVLRERFKDDHGA